MGVRGCAVPGLFRFYLEGRDCFCFASVGWRRPLRDGVRVATCRVRWRIMQAVDMLPGRIRRRREVVVGGFWMTSVGVM